MSPIRDILVHTANSYIAGFNTHTAEGVIACRTADCRRVIHPSSIPPPWNSPSRANEEYQGFVVPGFKMPRNVQICLAKGEEMLVAQVLCKVLLHLTSTGETDFGPYANEYMIVLKMTDDGTHIKEVVEFIDSATTRDIAAGLAQHVKPRVIMGVGATNGKTQTVIQQLRSATRKGGALVKEHEGSDVECRVMVGVYRMYVR